MFKISILCLILWSSKSLASGPSLYTALGYFKAGPYAFTGYSDVAFSPLFGLPSFINPSNLLQASSYVQPVQQAIKPVTSFLPYALASARPITGFIKNHFKPKASISAPVVAYTTNTPTYLSYPNLNAFRYSIPPSIQTPTIGYSYYG